MGPRVVELAKAVAVMASLVACSKSRDSAPDHSVGSAVADGEGGPEPAAPKRAPPKLGAPKLALPPLAERVDNLRYVGSTEVPPGEVVAISEHHTDLCAALEGGEVWCRRPGWQAIGWNAGPEIASLSADRERVCALSKEGAASCNSGPQLGVGPWRDLSVASEGACGLRRDKTLVCKAAAELEAVPAGVFTEIECHRARCCALLESGGARCWGEDAASSGWPAGELHDLGMSGNASCALDRGGSARCWGEFDPRSFSGEFESLVVGHVSGCGLDEDGRAHCWMFSVDERHGLPPVRTADAALGDDAGCLLDREGGLLCWGEEAFGPVPAGKFASLSGGEGAICGLREDGHPACWGASGEKIVGLPDEPLEALDAGTFVVCGLRSNGAITCWGSNLWGGTKAPAGSFTSLAVGNVSCALDAQGHASCWPGGGLDGAFVSLAAGSAYTCGLRAEGSIQCLVSDTFFNDRSDPTPPAGLRLGALYAGYEHLCGLDAGGHAHCWGRDIGGETSPPSDGTFSMLALGEKRSCGLTKAGEVRCWGGRPQPPPPDGPWSDLAMTENSDLGDPAYVCAIRKADAGVRCWEY